MHRVDDRLERRETLRGQPDTSADYNASIVCRSQVTLHRLRSCFIGVDETEIGLLSPLRHLLHCKGETGTYLSAHVWW